MLSLRSVAVLACTAGLVFACGSSSDSTFGPTETVDPGPGIISPIGDPSVTPEAGTLPIDPNCKPRTCVDQGIECGPAGDGCGGVIADCGTCGTGLRCGGPNAPSKCVQLAITTSCVAKSCAELNVACGPAGDGCGGLIASCGTCGSGFQCGGVGAPSQCVSTTAIGADGGACVPKTCADYPAGTCGVQSDGCNGVTPDCGACTNAGEFCGGGGPSKCGNPLAACVPKTCADYPTNCGPMPDGCGGVTCSCKGGACLDADGGTAPALCTAPQTCGGGGIPSVCGGGGVNGADGGACTALTTCAAKECGYIADGCGGTLDCGNTCTNGELCGGAGVANQCGKPACATLKFCPAGMDCGQISDGCGGTISCGGACTPPQQCGGGGVANKCGGGSVLADGGGACVPRTACLPLECGPIADGCGGYITCPGCTGGAVCGGGGTPSVCAGGTCTPRTQADCATLGFDCGFIADGCGGAPISCGTCPSGGSSACGVNSPNVCGSTVDTSCTNLCLDKPKTCGATNTTTITGTVYMPNGTLPVYNADVYVPNGAVGAVPEGVGASCDSCSAALSGSPLVKTKTNSAGQFTLRDMPVRAGGVPVVIQAGRWRKQITVTTTACATTAVATADTTFGGTETATNHIPKFAVTSGGADALQCLMRKLGIADSEFRQPGSGGRVNLYAGTLNGGTNRYRDTFNGLTGTATWTETAQATRIWPLQTYLFGNGSADLTKVDTSKLNKYDAVLLTCEGTEDPTSTLAPYRAEMKKYADDGGRVFATHWHHSWIEYGPDPWGSGSTTATPAKIAQIDHTNTLQSSIGTINTGFAKGLALAEWLFNTNPASMAGAGTLTFTNNGATGDYVERTSGSWITDGFRVGHTVTITGTTSNDVTGDITALTATRMTFGPTPALTTQTIASTGVTISAIGQSKLGITDARATISAIDTNRATSWVTVPATTPLGSTAVEYFDFNTPLNATTQCGRFVNSELHVSAGDGTGNGSNGGFPSNCTTTGLTDQEKVLAFMLFDLTSCIEQPVPKTCKKKTCADYPAGTCGQQSDGCGDVIRDTNGNPVNCLTCPNGQTCGGGGVASQCGTPTSCTPKTCAQAGMPCGSVPNGCGGLLVDCTVCPAGQTCGGGGVANQCGAPTCNALTCADQGIQCGQTGDGCGKLLTCPACPSGTTCGGGGVANQCGAPACTPLTTCGGGKNCGTAPDGCGGFLSCGTDCAGGQTCGGGGAANVCGAASCSPKTCAMLGAQCGLASDGCGGIAKNAAGQDGCGDCQPGSFCNGQNICVAQSCVPKTCPQLGIQCGPAADGCGGLIPDCGSCAPGTGCGAGGVPGQCGTNACTPKTCAQLDAQCGQVADGCGGLTPDCGTCANNLACNNGVCVIACTPRTCAQAGADCGSISDGCGGLLDCGQCQPGETCGYKTANVCGSDGPR